MGEPPHSNPQVSAPCFTPLGSHEYALADGEGPDGGDVLHLRIHGRIEHSDAKLILGLLDRITAQHGRVFFITHMIGDGGFSPEARRYYNDYRKQHPAPSRWSYVIGASLLVQTLTTLVLRGTKLLTGHEPSVQLVKSTAEALTLIGELRARLNTSGKPGS